MGGHRTFYLGLGLATFVTLTLEILTTRVFSVLTWYHLGFFAISIAMLGMTAGALWVYFRPASFSADAVRPALSNHSLAFAAAIPLSHVLTIRLRPDAALAFSDPKEIASLLAIAGLTTLPFLFSGVIVAVALAKVDAPIGRIYAADLLGAAAGCVGAVAIMERLDPTSATLLLGALSAFAALLFRHGEPSGRRARIVILSAMALLLVASIVNGGLYPKFIALRHSKGKRIGRDSIVDRWNSHSRIVAGPLKQMPPPYWWPGDGAPMNLRVGSAMNIDGLAGTMLTEFKGDPSELEWAKYDVTNLAYYLRGEGGETAVIGVGGGRDILSALAFGSAHVTGVELNQIFLDILARDPDTAKFAGIAGNPKVSLIHDEGRHYMTHAPGRFDLIQMSLIDTWASTSAGAMTLSENGLYTVEGWRAFLGALKPRGVFTVSRWFAPNTPSETARMISLAMATLIERGAERPIDHLFLACRGQISTLVVSADPFTVADLAKLLENSRRLEFEELLVPGMPVPDKLLAGIASSRTLDELLANVEDPLLDLRPPYDSSPFFFNIVKPSAWLGSREVGKGMDSAGVVLGNIYAGNTLLTLAFVVLMLTLLAIILPLFLFGRGHGLSRRDLASGLSYFSLIGVGFMLVEIPLMQRFSVLLGHPVYSLVVVLFSLILATGVGSLLSDRIFAGGGPRLYALPIAVAAAAAALAALLQPVIDAASLAPFAVRVAVAFACTTPLGLAMGCCFPVGMGLIARRSSNALAWMWGINGAFGVFGGVLAVVIAMASSITVALLVGAGCYLLLPAAIKGLLGGAAEKNA